MTAYPEVETDASGEATIILPDGRNTHWSRRRRRLYFECYTPIGLLLLPLVMSGFVASAVEQTNPNHLAREQSRYLNRAMKQPVDWYPWGADAFKRARKKLTCIAMLQGLNRKSESAGKGFPPSRN